MLIVVFTRTVDMYKMGYKIGILSRNRLISGISTAQKNEVFHQGFLQ